jgi:glycolate oxidase
MERNAVDWSMKYADINLDLNSETAAILIIEVDGNNLESLYNDCEKINEILEQNGCSNVLFADSSLEKDRLWKVRRICGEAVHAHSVYKEEDTVVPRFHLPELLTSIKEIGSKYGFESVCYGHAGDGNLHVNILKGELSDEQWNKTVKEGIREIFTICHNLGGTISGEHGIGLVQREYLNIVFDQTQIGLMKGIKQVFDPNGILNPGKIFPD